ncbi:MAG: hypothetical protein WA678_07705 [Rhabdochlamydiaceae bacterium]
MKNLSEEEILQSLHARREKSEVTYEEVTNPPYEVWGRAREWSYNQGICLLAGLVPISRPHLDLLLTKQSPLALIDIYLYYPIEAKDLNRLQNIGRLLESFPSVLQAKKNNQTMEPRELLALCKDHPEIAPFLPPKLIEVIDSLGPHLSLNLPNIFSTLELNPTAFQNMKKIKEREKKPLDFNSIVKENIPPRTPPIPPVPTEAPLAIAKRLFPLEDTEYWRKVDVISAIEILLLHYEIDPSICRVHPSEAQEDVHSKELANYLNQYFYGAQQWFLNELDRNGLLTLLQRSLDASTLQTVRGNKFSTIDIIKWMQSKNLSFPFVEEKQKETDTATTIDEILSYDFRSWTPDQQLRLMARITATAICKKEDLPLKGVVNHKASAALRKMWAELHGKEECADRTYEDYIRDVHPKYKSRK